MKKVTRVTCFLIIPLGILLFIEAFFMRNEGMYQSVVSSSAALLGMLPKGLVLLMSISLAAGIVRLGKKKILVQRLYALETLSHVDVLCLDKTGTLTTGKMKVDRVVELNTVSKEDKDHIASYLHHSTDSNATFEAMSQYFKAEDLHTPSAIVSFFRKKVECHFFWPSYLCCRSTRAFVLKCSYIGTRRNEKGKSRYCDWKDE